ncbi:MAG: hypothetical protein LBC68_15265 [Prevotellaceae bacterium]|jgi:hypothetical protein|nr:hypothetical protein [Prevotellaceae bacterium]
MMQKIRYTVLKIFYRLVRLVYVLKKSPLKKWGSIFFKTRQQILLDAIILHYGNNGKFQEEVDFLKERKELTIFPYKRIKQVGNIVSGYDSIKNLPYVIHKNRKLYFARSWTEEKSLWKYKDFIENENILGGGYMEKAPHQYQSESFHVKNSDILLDVGCAEALFALDVIDKVKKVILFESDPIWFEPLKATFEKEINEGKVVLIEKNVGEHDTSKSIIIASVLQNEDFESLFIKMDIEGNEVEVVKSCTNLMKSDKDIRFSCCTYHRTNDADTLKNMFESNGYKIEYSDGYILFLLDKHIKYPYFRKGIIRATNFNSHN